ncbi:MAG: sulfite exporter TauE/SafE family protein [Bacteroidales bacterium]
MTELIQSYELSTLQWILLGLSGLLIGMSKTGLSGVGLMVVPLMANAFGGRPSVGLLLPMLIFADIFAVSWYNRHAEWKHVFRLIPWALAGILLATVVGKSISDITFNRLLAVIVLLGIGILLWRDLQKNTMSIPDSRWFAASLGLLGGFATMIGNAAGPVMALYLLSMRLPKNTYIGTGAWFFFMVNLSKVPLHIWSWNTINWRSFQLDLLIVPAIAAGAFLGIWLVKLLPEKIFRIIVIVTTLLSALFLL